MAEPDKPVVVITGCSEGGIGHAVAREFASNGCLVSATARSLASMKSLEGDGRFFLVELDVLSEESIGKTVKGVMERFGRIDIVVNNAGVYNVAPLVEVPMSTVEILMGTNVYGGEWFLMFRILSDSALNGPLRLIKAVVPHMIPRRKGKIVNVGSVTALAPGPWAGTYSASKAALHALTDTLRLELRPFGIQVINLVPGAIRSNLGNSSLLTYEQMPEWKFYKPFEAAIRARANLSQNARSTPAEEFARKSVAIILKKNPPAWISSGYFSTVCAILYYLPLSVRDYLYRAAMKC